MSERPSIQHDPSSRQFFVDVDGQRACLAYMDLGKKTLDIYRTFVPHALRGRGIAAQLTEAALNYATQHGYEVIPSCSYVELYMQRQSRPAPRPAAGQTLRLA